VATNATASPTTSPCCGRNGGGAPWLLACYLQGSTLDDDGRNGILRRVGELAAIHMG